MANTHTGVDAHYTPSHIAKQLLSHIDVIPSGSIADFAAGGGELLLQATQRWPKREIIAGDISQHIVSALSRHWPDWQVTRCNFFSARSQAASPMLRAAIGGVALCLANPPFSYRGGQRWQVDTIDGTTMRCSPSVAFLLTAFKYLKPDGQILAILPANALRSEKDEAAIHLLSRVGVLEVLDTYPRGTFPSCTSKTVSVRFRRHRSTIQPMKSAVKERAIKLEVNLIRGCTPMHRVGPLRNGRIPVVHTSDLRDHSVGYPIHGVMRPSRLIKGPAVLLPRVGKPSSGKIAVYMSDEPVVLSDCVFALGCTSPSDALYLLNLLIDNWAVFSQVYHGTCAPYTTVKGLVATLTHLGIRVCANGSPNAVEGSIFFTEVAPAVHNRQ